jgi:hypothetical protein
MDMMEQFGKKSEWFSGLTPEMLNEIVDETIRAKLQQGINDNNVALFEEALTEIANLGEESSDESKALENATAVMESMPESVASAISNVRIDMSLSNGLLGLLGNSHANGLFSVPWDGYPAILHRGERVLTAGEAKTYNANSHLYVDNMYMNSDLDAERLADVLAERTRRVIKGYGAQ